MSDVSAHRDARLRILHAVEFYPPSRGGAQEVVRQISEWMGAQGHEVTVATSRLAERNELTPNGVRVEEFDISGNAVHGIRGSGYRYQRFLIEERFDVILTYAAQQWTTDLLLDVAEEIETPIVCAPCGYSALHDPAYRRYFEKLPATLRKLDATVYHSRTYQDIAFARANGLDNVHVIPNGAAAAEFGTADPEAGTRFRRDHEISGPLVLSVGSHTGVKGHRQTIAAFAVAPIGPATLIINGDERPGAGCGRTCRELARWLAPLLRAQGKRVLLLDLPRRELLAAYRTADVFMLLSRCECSPVVLFEAAASGTPFISTDAGNAREISEWTEAGVVLDPTRTVARAAAALTGLLRDADRRGAMSRAGRETWLKRFTWERAAESYLALYRTLVGSRAPAAAR